MDKRLFNLSAVLAILAVAIGAFGAHGLADILTANNRIDTFETGSKYHFYHVFAIFITSIVPIKQKRKIAALFFLGIILFSGSLYTLSITNITIFGAIAPIGGTAFIAGWVWLLVAKKS
ncbi:MAG: DUF423 domain-containing protein [Cyclobacteriaceae bacterium]